MRVYEGMANIKKTEDFFLGFLVRRAIVKTAIPNSLLRLEQTKYGLL